MDRFYISPDRWSESLSLRGEEAHHCRRVMRKRVGDAIEVFDGCGHWARGVITALGDEVTLDIEESGESSKAKIQVELAVGIPKGKTFDLIVQKAVELGVTCIQPLMTEQGMVKISEKEAPKKTAKWQRLALEACKQCGQNWLTKVEKPQSFSKWIHHREPADRELIAALTPESRALRDVLSELAGDSGVVVIRVLVGPEGDFSEAEYGVCFEQEMMPVGLGNLVLRAETAVIYVLSNIFCQLSC